MFKFSSMQNQKAIVQFSSNVLTYFTYGGKQPVDTKLMGYYQISFKKFNILSGIAKNGTYVGPGWDRHVLRFAACHLPLTYSGYSEEFLFDILRQMNEKPGGYMNEIVANIGQNMNRGTEETKALLNEVFEDAISIKPDNENIDEDLDYELENL